MAELVVVVPSRGRPDAARELADAFEDTCTADTELVFAVDDDDPTAIQYEAVAGPHVWVCGVSDPVHMVHALNQAAESVLRFVPATFAVGFQGDDHRPRTVGWDTAYLEALRDLGTGIVYGNDLLQGRNLPTQCAMTTNIVRVLGYMAPPALRHMYVDNFWLALGQGADCIRYLPDVVVEHRHPVAGKAQWDEGYRRVNDPGVYDHDGRVFAEYVQGELPQDIAKVRALTRAMGGTNV